VVYDGVVGPWFIDRFMAWAGLSAVHYAVLMPSEEVCVQRVRQRADHGFVDEPATRQMWREFAEVELPGRHVLRLSDGDAPDQVARRVRDAVSAGRLLRRSAAGQMLRASFSAEGEA
jgi:hypothetical protein